MANIALGKSILEDWENPKALTDGIFDDYSRNGFTHTLWPKYITLDLEKIYEVETIRFLLWNNDSRTYHYRLLTSCDFESWAVYFDSSYSGGQGWQEFNFKDKIKARYVRLHCIRNSANIAFHLLELQVYNSNTEELSLPVNFKKTISTEKKQFETEIGAGLSLSSEMKNLTVSLEKIVTENEYIINVESFRKMINSFRLKIYDVEVLEHNIESIRRQIINPVKSELEEGKRLGKFSVLGFYVGFAGIIISIFAILNDIFHFIK